MGTEEFLKDAVTGTSLGYSETIEDLYSSKFFTYVWSSGYEFHEMEEGSLLTANNFSFSTVSRVVYPLTERGKKGEFLFDAFANMNPENKQEIIDFCDKFGLLQDESLRGKTPLPNLFSWTGIKREVYFIKALLNLWETSNAPKPENLEKLRSMMEVQYHDLKNRRIPLLVYRLDSPQKYENFLHLGVAPHDDGLPLADSDVAVKMDDFPLVGKLIVAKEINNRLREYAPHIQTFLDNKHNLTPYIKPSSLISAIWLQFHQYITGTSEGSESRIVRCLHCGKRGLLSEGGWISGRSGEYEGKFYHRKCADAARQRHSRDRRKSKETGQE
jgi:hypothetical protein